MKHLSFIFILFVVTCDAQTQTSTKISKTYKGIEGLYLVSPLDSSHIITTFQFGRGFEGAILEIRPHGEFKESLFSCDGIVPIDSGAWKLSGNKLLIGKLSYELFRVESLYYLIESSEKEKFITDLRKAVSKAKNDSGTELSYTGKVLWAMRSEYFMK